MAGDDGERWHYRSGGIVKVAGEAVAHRAEAETSPEGVADQVRRGPAHAEKAASPLHRPRVDQSDEGATDATAAVGRARTRVVDRHRVLEGLVELPFDESDDLARRLRDEESTGVVGDRPAEVGDGPLSRVVRPAEDGRSLVVRLQLGVEFGEGVDIPTMTGAKANAGRCADRLRSQPPQPLDLVEAEAELKPGRHLLAVVGEYVDLVAERTSPRQLTGDGAVQRADGVPGSIRFDRAVLHPDEGAGTVRSEKADQAVSVQRRHGGTRAARGGDGLQGTLPITEARRYGQTGTVQRLVLAALQFRGRLVEAGLEVDDVHGQIPPRDA